MSENTSKHEGALVVCVRGHVHQYSDLDKNGLNYYCSECFTPVSSADVTAARMGRNKIDARYIETGGDCDDE